MSAIPAFKSFAVCALFGLCVSVAPREARAQPAENLYVYGYFQGFFGVINEEVNVLPTPDRHAGFLLQQLNLMVAKDLGDQFSAFVNLELTNSFRLPMDGEISS